MCSEHRLVTLYMKSTTHKVTSATPLVCSAHIIDLNMIHSDSTLQKHSFCAE
jgi:hypothetical protein